MALQARLAGVLAALLIFSTVALPQRPPRRSDGGRQEQLGTPPEGQDKQEAPKPKTFDDAIKDFTKMDGVFTLYRKDKTLKMEISPDQLEKNFLLQATRSTGAGARGVVAGDPISDTLFLFRKQDEAILVVAPNINFRTTPGTPLEKAMKRSFPEGYIATLKIEATHPDRKTMLVDVSSIFTGDLAKIGESVTGMGGYTMDAQKTAIASVKDFPTNFVVETNYHFTSRGGSGLPGSESTLADSRSMPMKVVYNLFGLPETGYVPRLYDDRVGYFTVDFRDYSDDVKQDRTTRYVTRWDIRKKDPTAAMSEPAKPVVFWVDNAVPFEFRDSVRNGVLYWNKAFESIGIKDAIVVKQMPDDADWDHADLRYNVVRWVTSPDDAYAVAQARNNPITGEIINAQITVDQGMAQFTNVEFAEFISPNTYAPAYDPSGRRCEIGKEMVREAAFGELAMELLAKPRRNFSRLNYVQSFIESTVAHEMGHILGLRHNFTASTTLTPADLCDPSVTSAKGISSSVMDYDPVNVWALKTNGQFFTSTIGPYDMWAVEYGYREYGAKSPLAESGDLKKVAARCNEPGLAFQSDELADRWDPAVTRFDLSADPLQYYAEKMKISKEMLDTLGSRKPVYGGSYYELTQAFSSVLNAYFGAANRVARYVGGSHASRNHKGDPNEKPALFPISVGQQREALALILTGMFAERSIQIPREVLANLAINPNPSFMDSIIGRGDDMQVKDVVLNAQNSLMKRLFSDSTLNRILNNELKAGKSGLSLSEVFNGFDGAVWTDLNARKNVSLMRRGLQRDHLDLMIQLSNGGESTPDDAKALAWNELKQVRDRLAGALVKPDVYDTITRVHLEQSLEKVKKTLAAQYSLSPASAPVNIDNRGPRDGG